MIYYVCVAVLILHTILFLNWAKKNYIMLLLESESESFEEVNLNLLVAWFLQSFILLLLIGIIDFFLTKTRIYTL